MPHPRVTHLAPGEPASAWADALADPAWERSATLLKDDGDVTVRRARLIGRDVVVKRWTLASPKRRLQALLNRTPARRQWRGAERLARLAPVATPRVLLRVRPPASPASPAAPSREYLVMDRAPGESLLRLIASGELSTEHLSHLGESLGRTFAQMHAARLANRDAKPSNVFVTLTRTAPPSLTFIDTEGVRSSRRPFARHLAEHLARLSIEPHGVSSSLPPALLDAAIAGAIDALARPLPPAARTRLEREVRERTDALLRAHPDPTPRIDPLSTPADASAGK